MAKEIIKTIKLQIPAGAANPAPPVGPALGQAGVNIMMFCKEFNAQTQKAAGDILPVVITVYKDKSFSFITKQPPASLLLKKAAGIASGSSSSNGKSNKSDIAADANYNAVSTSQIITIGTPTAVTDALSGASFNIYPNPMAGKGTLAYTLDAAAMVNATISDITGKEIAVLKEEHEQAGSYNVDIAKTLPAGMYFAKLTVNGESYTKKFVVE